MADATDVARRLFAAIEAGDVDAIRDCYSPDAQIWHNTDRVTKNLEHTMAIVEWMCTNLPGMKYTDPQCSVTEDGFVQRHVVVGTRPDGVTVELPCCIVATVADGRVTHLYEYFDSVQAAEIGAPM